MIEHCIYIADAPVLMHGRVELLWYVCEQSVCVDYHRYGNLGARTDEPRPNRCNCLRGPLIFCAADGDIIGQCILVRGSLSGVGISRSWSMS